MFLSCNVELLLDQVAPLHCAESSKQECGKARLSDDLNQDETLDANKMAAPMPLWAAAEPPVLVAGCQSGC